MRPSLLLRPRERELEVGAVSPAFRPNLQADQAGRMQHELQDIVLELGAARELGRSSSASHRCSACDARPFR